MAGTKPNPGTPADMRLRENQAGAGMPMGGMDCPDGDCMPVDRTAPHMASDGLAKGEPVPGCPMGC